MSMKLAGTPTERDGTSMWLWVSLLVKNVDQVFIYYWPFFVLFRVVNKIHLSIYGLNFFLCSFVELFADSRCSLPVYSMSSMCRWRFFSHFSSCFFNLHIICFYILTVIVNFTKIKGNSETSWEKVFILLLLGVICFVSFMPTINKIFWEKSRTPKEFPWHLTICKLLFVYCSSGGRTRENRDRKWGKLKSYAIADFILSFRLWGLRRLTWVKCPFTRTSRMGKNMFLHRDRKTNNYNQLQWIIWSKPPPIRSSREEHESIL